MAKAIKNIKTLKRALKPKKQGPVTLKTIHEDLNKINSTLMGLVFSTTLANMPKVLGEIFGKPGEPTGDIVVEEEPTPPAPEAPKA